MDLSGNNKNKITGKKYQPVMSVTGLNDQGLIWSEVENEIEKSKVNYIFDSAEDNRKKFILANATFHGSVIDITHM